ncbi:MAG: polysaccharide deacetylase family protein [Vicinamibacterales bacterium]
MNVFTVDVEEWFHVCGIEETLPASHWESLSPRVLPTTMRVLDLLEQAGVSGTFFVVGWIAERYPHLIASIAAAGHEVGSHSQWHRRVYELDPDAFAGDLAQSVRCIAAAGVPVPTAYRAPEWSINDRAPWALDELTRQGFTVDASMAPLKIVGRVEYRRDPHVRITQGGSIVEVPPLVADRFGQVMPLGWGWGLRMSSPQRVLRAIGELNDSGRPAVLTIHPWELDPDPPRMSLPLRLRFAHNFRLSGFESRLKTIVHAAPFSTLREVARCARAA